MVRIKPGVKLHNLQPQLVLAMMVADAVWDQDGDDLTITSCNDSYHSHTSLHYAGAAIDVRTRDVLSPEIKVAELQDALGKDFDVIYEGAGTSNEHIHIEYQPRR